MKRQNVSIFKLSAAAAFSVRDWMRFRIKNELRYKDRTIEQKVLSKSHVIYIRIRLHHVFLALGCTSYPKMELSCRVVLLDEGDTSFSVR